LTANNTGASVIPGPTTGYTDLLDYETTESLKKEAATGEKWNPLRPSASGKCERELYYELMEYYGLAAYEKELKTPATQRLLDLGNPIERHAIYQFEKNVPYIKLKYKQQVLSFYKLEASNPKYAQQIEGSLDACFFSADSRGVIDFKSKKDKFSAFYRTNWDETDEKLRRMATVRTISESAYWVEDLAAFLEELNDAFFAANFLQLNGYACTDFLQERGVDHGAIIQYNKNDSRMREVRFRPSPELYEAVRAKFQNVVTAVDTSNTELARRDYALGSLKCAFCPFQKECWGENANGKKAFFDSLPPKKWPTDTRRLKAAGAALEDLFAKFEELSQAEKEKERVELSIAKLMADTKVGKVKLDNGTVYEVKQLKERLSVRRSKI
jgi:hypothetical protein